MRASRDNMLMNMADSASLRGTCSRLQVGAVVSRDGRVISTGYNGSPAGLPHCDHFVLHRGMPTPDWVVQTIEHAFAPGPVNFPQEGTLFSRYEGEGYAQGLSTGSDAGCPISEHAERNAIAFAARYGTALDGAEMHVTHAPCANCARMIINAGIKRVSYRIPYRLTVGIELLNRAGVEVIEYVGDPAPRAVELDLGL